MVCLSEEQHTERRDARKVTEADQIAKRIRGRIQLGGNLEEPERVLDDKNENNKIPLSVWTGDSLIFDSLDLLPKKTKRGSR